MHVDWQGVFPAATTQFKADQSLDVAATLAHVDAMIEAGIDGLIMLGTVGENCSLDAAEKRELLRATVAHVRGRVPVLSGVAEYTTALARRFARDAEEIGVQGLMVLPAMVYKSDARETIARTIARSLARAACRSCATTIRSRTAWTSRPNRSPSSPTSRRSWRSRSRPRTRGGSPT